MSPLSRTILGYWAATLAVIAAGVAIAHRTMMEEWVERTGHVVLVLSLGLSFLQLRYEFSHEDDAREAERVASTILESRPLSPEERAETVRRIREQMDSRFSDTRRRLIAQTLAGAAVGELVAAFGGRLFDLIVR